MSAWDGIALRTARKHLGLTLQQVAKLMTERSQLEQNTDTPSRRTSISVDTVRRIEGSYIRGGVVRAARPDKVLLYCRCLRLDEKEYRKRLVRLLSPTYVDFRPTEPYQDDPSAQSWRNSALRVGIGHLELEVERGANIRVLEVRLQTDLFDHIAMPPSNKTLSREENYSKVMRLQHWCQWQAGQTLNEEVEVEEDWGALGVVILPGLAAESEFNIPANGLKEEAMFSQGPDFATWYRFVSLWERHPKDIRFNLTVRYRDEATNQIDLLRTGFVVDGNDVQELSKQGLALQRGFPAFMQPYVCEYG